MVSCKNEKALVESKLSDAGTQPGPSQLSVQHIRMEMQPRPKSAEYFEVGILI